MRKATRSIVIPLVLSFSSIQFVNAQITLTTSDDYISKPAGVISEAIKVSGITTVAQITSLSSSYKVKTYNYVDGFGRPLQSIVEGITPAGKDLIQQYMYDEFGRQTTRYLPFEYTSVGSGQPYQNRTTALTNQASFYTTNNTSNKIPYETKPWVSSEVEASPMQRLLKQGSVGDGFQTNQHYKTAVYRVLDGSDAAVRKWAPDATSSGTYSANDLSVAEAIDEDGATNGAVTLVYTDKMGRTVLKRQKADQTIGGTSYTYFDTYYVYDLLGNIAYVIPPKAVVELNSIGGTWDATSTTPDLIFSYVYDNKNRVIEKKVPGADVVYIVYDPLDRPVLTQSGTMRDPITPNYKWFYSKYDASGRVVEEGIYTDNTYTTRSDMQTYVNGLSYYYSSSTTWYEERTSGGNYLYTNNCFPTSNTEPRIYNYYDDYDKDGNGSSDHTYISQSLPGEGTATAKTLGLPTMTRKKVLGTSNWLISINFYDNRYRIIQVMAGNAFYPDGEGKTMLTNVVDFEGKVIAREEEHTIGRTMPLGTPISLSIRNTYSYDKANRLTRVKQGHNGGTMIIVADYEYNPLGQLVDKKLHSTNNGSSYLQSVDFRYNIRGQLTSINNSTLTSDAGVTNDETNDVWGMNLFYEQEENASGQIGNTANWTGMLSAVKWKASITGGNTDERSYVFAYDKLYRLVNAEYKAFDPTPRDWSKHVKGYDEIASYDWNGNILSMERWAVLSGTRTKIDEMTYSYASDKNRLEDVTEASSNSYGYIDFTSSTSGNTYDANGNLTDDARKGITIVYNELNKPVTITENSSGHYVEYTYDAAGARISKKTVTTSTTTLNYLGGVVCDAGSTTFKYFSMAEGRVRVSGSSFTYEYFITDQQGNVRVSFEDNGSGSAVARQENSYYPFGMIMPGNYTPSNPNKWLYNAGSEWQDDLGGVINFYSTFFREYDPIIGRFNSVDPKADMKISLTIYQYSSNNPANFNDPMGDIDAPTNAQQLLSLLQNAIKWGSGVDFLFRLFGQADKNVMGWSFGRSGSVFYAFNTTANNKYDFEEEVMIEQVRAFILKGKASRENLDKKYGKDNHSTEWNTPYYDAVDRITSHYPNLFKNVYKLHGTDLEFIEGVEFKSPEIRGEIPMMQFGYTAFDLFAVGDQEGFWTFGELSRTIYHEYIHVYLCYGDLSEFPNKITDRNEGEFIAYYLMHLNNGLPDAGSKAKRDGYNQAAGYYFLGWNRQGGLELRNIEKYRNWMGNILKYFMHVPNIKW